MSLRRRLAGELSTLLDELGLDAVYHESGWALREHSFRVAETLARWGCDESVVRAGAAHSLYTWSGDPSPKLRALLARLLGDEAEQLCFEYSRAGASSPPAEPSVGGASRTGRGAPRDVRVVAIEQAHALERLRSAVSSDSTRRRLAPAGQLRTLLPETAVAELELAARGAELPCPPPPAPSPRANDVIVLEQDGHGDEAAVWRLYNEKVPVLRHRTSRESVYELVPAWQSTLTRDPDLEQALDRVFHVPAHALFSYRYVADAPIRPTLLIAMSNAWALWAWAGWIREHGIPDSLLLVRLDAHPDLAAPSLLATAERSVYHLPVGGQRMNILDPSDVERAIERGFVGIGSFVAPFVHALGGACEIVHLVPSAATAAETWTDHHRLTRIHEPLQGLGRGGLRPALRLDPSEFDPLAGSRYVAGSGAAAIAALNLERPIFLDIDMDYFCNDYDDRLNRTEADGPSSAEVARRIEATGELLRAWLPRGNVVLASISLSPGFFPARHWEESLAGAVRIVEGLAVGAARR